MKRAVAALVMLGIAAVTAAPGSAATTVYGSAQLKYTVNATASISVAVNYDVNGAIQPGTASSILASVAGNCAAGVSEASNATLTFGAVTPPAAGYTSCYYKNALSVGVNSNDAAGVKVIEYVDALQAGTTICAYNLDASGPKNKPTRSSATAIAGANTCPAATGGIAGTPLSALGAVTAGAGYGAQGNPGAPATVVTAGAPTATTYTAGGFTLYTVTGSAPPAGWNFLGEDVSLNVSAAAPSGAQTSVITIALIPQ